MEFYKFIYHETTMIVPLANAIFEDKLIIDDFIKLNKKKNKQIFFNRLNFLKVDRKRFPLFLIKPRLNEHYSTPIVINAANEILVDQFLKKKIQFTSFSKYLLMVLNDRNYKKNAIKIPKNINQIFEIDKWSRNIMKKKLLKDTNA